MDINKPTFSIIDRLESQRLQGKNQESQIENRDHIRHIDTDKTIVDSFSTNLNFHIAVLNENGILISVNNTTTSTNVKSPLHLSDSSIGCNYFTEC